jgi:peptide deformylase
MPARAVLRYPDPRLKQPCAAVDDFDLAARVAADLVETMRSHPRCVGLAAPQIGELLRLVAIDVTGHPKAGASARLVRAGRLLTRRATQPILIAGNTLTARELSLCSLNCGPCHAGRPTPRN